MDTDSLSREVSNKIFFSTGRRWGTLATEYAQEERAKVLLPQSGHFLYDSFSLKILQCIAPRRLFFSTFFLPFVELPRFSYCYFLLLLLISSPRHRCRAKPVVIVHFNYFWNFRVFSGSTASGRPPRSFPTIKTLCKLIFLTL
jgi:hypothetical protein